MKKNETVADFLNRFLAGYNAENVIVRIEADDMLPIIGNKENVLKRLETHELYMGELKVMDYNNITVRAIFRAYK